MSSLPAYGHCPGPLWHFNNLTSSSSESNPWYDCHSHVFPKNTSRGRKRRAREMRIVLRNSRRYNGEKKNLTCSASADPPQSSRTRVSSVDGTHWVEIPGSSTSTLSSDTTVQTTIHLVGYHGTRWSSWISEAGGLMRLCGGPRSFHVPYRTSVAVLPAPSRYLVMLTALCQHISHFCLVCSTPSVCGFILSF